MISKVLVANRGEIAVRVIRACKELGIKTVAIYSDADKEAMHTQLADEAICVGAGKSKDSYLNEINIISAAVTTKCNAIHPGFGFCLKMLNLHLYVKSVILNLLVLAVKQWV